MKKQLRTFLALLRRVPAGVWAALASGLAIFALYLRGRRLEAELAEAKVKHESAMARLSATRDSEKAAVHIEKAATHERKIRELEAARKILAHANEEEAKRLAALPPDRIHEEFLRRAEVRRRELGGEP